MKTKDKLIILLSHPIDSLFHKLLKSFYKSSTTINRLVNYKRFDIHPTVKFWHDTRIYGNGKIYIGKGTYFGHYTFIVAFNNTKISIGENCAISHGVHIRTADTNVDSHKNKIKEKKTGNILIGNNVWVGANVFITAGVTIGDNVAIGANSVVTKSFGDNCVIAGSPAKIIKEL
ncbi:MAG: acyltransferase [Salinivirgaceae bacterium]